MYSRTNLKAQEKKAKEADAFVDGGDSPVSSRPVGRPKQKGEKREPVTLSLTKTEAQLFDKIHKRLNFIHYSNGIDISLDRSSFIRAITDQCEKMTDDELLKWFNYTK
ncbi:hypothetical protein VH1709_contig00020-0010 [Vibrio harveyi]|uniref:hypothetical protein n=1 Tax=Vibrio harveyi TaxID=669 RepID=UPI000681A1BE|nr:hypothetical protein [Vibrio harveyi]APP09170.1 hypothetical protein BG259_28230 [Vibrio harveyi]GBK97999.1 hypothetical protein VH1709_contig00020-0010 [Vibrio harveyi]HDZ5419703.1 hypothetical protein [Vibrio harveyi]